MKKLLFIALVLTSIILSSCQKQPTANFTFDKTTYNAGETVVITNASIDAHHYEWTFPGDQTSSEVNPSYQIPMSASGILSFTLVASSRDGQLTSTLTKSINVIPKTGNAVFWQSESYDNITVSLDGYTENIVDKRTTEPACGATDCANFTDLVLGDHNYTATDGNYQWQGVVTITENGCTRVKLEYSNATQR